jgi:hypothetical protein
MQGVAGGGLPLVRQMLSEASFTKGREGEREREREMANKN